MEPVRPPAVAGSFYPRQPDALRQMVRQFLDAAVLPPEPVPSPVALIAPHAGYLYSGPIAGSAYGCLQRAETAVTRVVLLGPAHTLPVRGLAASSAAAFATPLGQVPLDQRAVRQLLALPQVVLQDEAHAREHGLEVHLPFLQIVLRDRFQLIPLVVGDAAARAVTAVLEQLWRPDDTLIVVSSDLSHYLGYAAARERDAATARAIESLAPEKLAHGSACGRIPVQGLLQFARQQHWRIRTLDLRNSGDTAGPKDRVVGYGAWLVGQQLVKLG